jgi:hypothetical protein
MAILETVNANPLNFYVRRGSCGAGAGAGGRCLSIGGRRGARRVPGRALARHLRAAVVWRHRVRSKQAVAIKPYLPSRVVLAQEFIIVSTTGRIVSSWLTGATMSLTHQYPGQYASFGGDLCADPYDDGGNICGIAGTSTVSTGDAYTVVFPGGAYGATEVSTVYYVNRMGGTAGRITAGDGVISLLTPTNSLWNYASITSAGTVSEFSFSTSLAPVYPEVGDPLQAAYASTWVRYVRLAAAPGNCLGFKELFVLDNTLTNVALLKATNASAQTSGAAAANGVDGVIEYDDATTTYLTQDAACDGSGWWQVDLGGVYNVSMLLLWNRYFPSTVPSMASRMQNATVTLLNAYGAAVGNVVLTGNAVQNISVSLYPPSPSATPTRSASATASTTGTPTASLSGGATASATMTSTPTASGSPTTTASPSQTPSASATPPSSYPYQAIVQTVNSNALNFVVRRGVVRAGRRVNERVIG